MYNKEMIERIKMIINKKRALAYTAKIEWIKPIEGADNIELVGVLGWTCIAKIGEFAIGDTCVYFEIDSKLPETDWSAFLANKHYKVKTMKLGKFKVISQGLALPFSAFEGITLPVETGVDLTDTLKVTYSVEEDNKRKNMDCSVHLDNVKDFITSDKFTHFLLAETTDFGTAAFIILQTLMNRVAELENSEDDLLDEEE